MINQCFIGDCRDGLKRFAESGVKVQTCITSPPYYGLRDYGVPDQLGLEETLNDYIENMAGVFDLVADVLADDGTLWLNIGDSYAGSWGAQGKSGEMANRRVSISRNQIHAHPKRRKTGAIRSEELKPKDMMGVPWRLAFELQRRGWYLRQDIIWHKPNPMPESVKDRCTKSHEYLFLLTKSERYYYDADAIKEKSNYPDGPNNMENSKYGRQWVGCELNPEYVEIQKKRLQQQSLAL